MNDKFNPVIEVDLEESHGDFNLAYGNRVEEVKFLHEPRTKTNMCVVRLEGGLEIIISAQAALDCMLTAPKDFIKKGH